MHIFCLTHKSSKSRKKGYTLIELLVAIGIALIIMGIGIASFFRFKDRQNLVKAKEELATAIHTAQANAASGKLGDCTEGLILKGYHLYHTADNKIMMESVCHLAVGSFTEQEMIDLSDFNIENRDLVSEIEYQDGTVVNGVDLNLYFRVLTGDLDDRLYRYHDAQGNPIVSNASPAQSWTIEFLSQGHTYQFELTRSGEVSEGEFL